MVSDVVGVRAQKEIGVGYHYCFEDIDQEIASDEFRQAGAEECSACGEPSNSNGRDRSF